MTIAVMGRNQRGRRVLEERRTALMAELRQDIHDAFAGVDTVCMHDTMDDIDASVATELSSVRFNVMQMKGDALVRIDEALIDPGGHVHAEAQRRRHDRDHEGDRSLPGAPPQCAPRNR